MEVIHKKPGAIGEGQERALINSNVSGVEGQIGKFPSVPEGAGPMWSARTAGTASPGPPVSSPSLSIRQTAAPYIISFTISMITYLIALPLFRWLI